MFKSRKILQEELVTHIEQTIADLEASLTAYRAFMLLPIPVQICSEQDFDNVGVSMGNLVTLVCRELRIPEEDAFSDHIQPATAKGLLIAVHLPGKGYYYLQSDEMYATLEPIRDFKRRIEAGGV